MMTPQQRIRATVDRLNKTKAARPAMPKVNEQRSLDELINTGANARGMAKMNVKASTVGAIEPLAVLIKKARK